MIHRCLKQISIVVCAFYLAGCASIFSGSAPQALSIMTEPAGVDLEIVNMRTADTILRTKTPYTAMLERKDGAFQPSTYYVILTLPGYYEENIPVNTGTAGWYWGNIIFGYSALLGILIDGSTGAAFSLDNTPIKVKLYPTTPEGRVSMATEKYNGIEPLKSGDFDKAIEHTTKAISLHPKYVEGYCTRAECYIKKNELDKAMLDVNKAIEIKSDFPNAYKMRAEISLLNDDTVKAISDLDKAISLKPDYAEAYLIRGKAQQKQKNMVAAKADIKKAAELGNESAKNFQF